MLSTTRRWRSSLRRRRPSASRNAVRSALTTTAPRRAAVGGRDRAAAGEQRQRAVGVVDAHLDVAHLVAAQRAQQRRLVRAEAAAPSGWRRPKCSAHSSGCRSSCRRCGGRRSRAGGRRRRDAHALAELRPARRTGSRAAPRASAAAPCSSPMSRIASITCVISPPCSRNGTRSTRKIGSERTPTHSSVPALARERGLDVPAAPRSTRSAASTSASALADDLVRAPSRAPSASPSKSVKRRSRSSSADRGVRPLRGERAVAALGRAARARRRGGRARAVSERDGGERRAGRRPSRVVLQQRRAQRVARVLEDAVEPVELGRRGRARRARGRARAWP